MVQLLYLHIITVDISFSGRAFKSACFSVETGGRLLLCLDLGVSVCVGVGVSVEVGVLSTCSEFCARRLYSESVFFPCFRAESL